MSSPAFPSFWSWVLFNAAEVLSWSFSLPVTLFSMTNCQMCMSLSLQSTLQRVALVCCHFGAFSNSDQRIDRQHGGREGNNQEQQQRYDSYLLIKRMDTTVGLRVETSIKCLHLSVGPRNPHKDLSMVVYACNPGTREEREKIPRTCWLTSLAKLGSSKFIKRLCLQTKVEDGCCQPLASTCTHTCRHTSHRRERADRAVVAFMIAVCIEQLVMGR